MARNEQHHADTAAEEDLEEFEGETTDEHLARTILPVDEAASGDRSERVYLRDGPPVTL